MTFLKKYYWNILPPFLAIIIYITALPGPFLWDDFSIIQSGKEILSFSDIIQIFSIKYWNQLEQDTAKPYRKGVYRPLRNLSFSLEKKLWEDNAFGYRLTNLIIHAINSSLISVLGKTFFSSNPAGLAAGLFFASHPGMVESVSYIKNRGNLISAFLFILYMFSWLHNKHFLFNFIYIIALLTMESNIVFPLVIFCYIFFFYKRDQWIVHFKNLKIQLIISLIYFTMIFIILKPYQGLNSIEMKMIVSTTPVLIRIYSSLIAYLKLYIYPSILCIDRPLEIINSFYSIEAFIYFICAIISSWFIIIYTDYPKIFFTLLMMIIFLLPVLNIIPLDSRPFAEQRIYLPMAGGAQFFSGIFIAVLSNIKKKNRSLAQIKKIFIYMAYCVLIFIICVFTIFSIKRNQLYRTPSLLWLDAQSKFPDVARIHYKLGGIYYLNHEYEKSIISLTKCLEIDPKFYKVYERIGRSYIKLNDKEQAIIALLRELENNPDSFYPNVLLAQLYLEKRDYNKAYEFFYKAHKTAPEDDHILLELGNIYLLKKDYNKAMYYFLRSLDINPDNHNALNNIGSIYLHKKDYYKAIEKFQSVLKIDPENTMAAYNTAYSYQLLKNYDQAVKYYQKTISLEFLYYDAYYNMAYSLHKNKNQNKAVEVYTRLLKIKPDYFEAYKSLGDLYFELKDNKNAAVCYKKYMKFNNNNQDLYNKMKYLIYEKNDN